MDFLVELIVVFGTSSIAHLIIGTWENSYRFMMS